MSYSADSNNGNAYIEVETSLPPTTIVTRRVKTHARAVIWKVTNYADEPVTVCVKEFQPHHDTRRDLAPDDILWPLGDCTGPLAKFQVGRIIGIFNIGAPGDVYDYVIKVNGTNSTDPQLEI